jgi:hypothetical protein
MGRAAGYRWDAIEFAEEMNWDKSMGIFDDLANTYMQSLEMKKQAELDNYEKTLESITGLFQELTSGVNGINEQLGVLFETAEENNFDWYDDFKIEEAFGLLGSRYDEFWDQANPARERYLSNHDIDQFKNAIDLRIYPAALKYLEPSQALIRNIPNVAYMCMMNQKVDGRLDKINEHLDFDYSEFSEIEFDAAILHDLKAKIYECYERIFQLGQDLIREWQPYGVEAIPGWKDNYDLALKEFQEYETKIINNANHARSMFRKLWEIRKQVELSSVANKASAIDSPFERLEKLGGLLEKGLITKGEYDEKKAHILKEI